MLNNRINKFYLNHARDRPYYFIYETNSRSVKEKQNRSWWPPSHTTYLDRLNEKMLEISERIKQNVTFVHAQPDTLFFVFEIDPIRTDDDFELWHVLVENKAGWIIVDVDSKDFREYKIESENNLNGK